MFDSKISNQKRVFSSEPELKPVELLDHQNDPSPKPVSNTYESSERKKPVHVFLTEFFSRKDWSDAVKREFETLNLSLDDETILLTLKNLEGSPETALRFFNLVSETGSGKLCCKAYNLMLVILGRKDHLNEFWPLVERLKKNGYGIRKNTFAIVSEEFTKEKMVSDAAAFKERFLSQSGVNSVDLSTGNDNLCSRLSRIINESDWGEEVERKLGSLNLNLSDDLVAGVLEKLSSNPIKALMFFLWVDSHTSYKHNGTTFNAMAQVLGQSDSLDQFWSTINEMKNAGFSMEMATYFTLSGWFYKRKMLKEAVDLYDFMMGNLEKPPVQDSGFLLRKIAISHDPDMDLFSRVVKIHKSGGYAMTKSMFDGIVRSLTSVGKLHQAGKFLRVLDEDGSLPSETIRSEILFKLCKAMRLKEACEFLEEMEASGFNPDSKAWGALIEGHCLFGEVDKASAYLRKMVVKNGVADCRAVQILVKGFCDKNRAKDAFTFLTETAKDIDLRPSHSTYNILIRKLLREGMLKEASKLLPVMKNHGFPPLVDPFIDHISKSGTGDDAMVFLKAMSTKSFPSTSVFLCMFEAFFKAGRHFVAQDFLSKSPSFIRNHADVLDLFCCMMPKEELA